MIENFGGHLHDITHAMNDLKHLKEKFDPSSVYDVYQSAGVIASLSRFKEENLSNYFKYYPAVGMTRTKQCS